MFTELLIWFFKKIDKYENKLNDLKLIFILSGLFMIFIICFVIPWTYGITKICLLIFKGV